MPAKLNFSEKFNSFFNRYYSWLLILLVLAVLGVGWFWLLSPQLGQLFAVAPQLQDLDSQANQLREQIIGWQQRPAPQINLTPVEQKILDWFLPPQYDFTSVAAQLIALCGRHNVTVRGITVVPEGGNGVSADSHLHRVKVSLDISLSSYEELRNFLRALDSSAMVLEVPAVTLPANGLDIYTYYYQ